MAVIPQKARMAGVLQESGNMQCPKMPKQNETVIPEMLHFRILPEFMIF